MDGSGTTFYLDQGQSFDTGAKTVIEIHGDRLKVTVTPFLVTPQARPSRSLRGQIKHSRLTPGPNVG